MGFLSPPPGLYDYTAVGLLSSSGLRLPLSPLSRVLGLGPGEGKPTALA